MIKLKDNYTVKIESNKSILENIKKENNSLKAKVEEMNDNLATSRAPTSHVHAKPHNSFARNRNHDKRYHNNIDVCDLYTCFTSLFTPIIYHI